MSDIATMPIRGTSPQSRFPIEFFRENDHRADRTRTVEDIARLGGLDWYEAQSFLTGDPIKDQVSKTDNFEARKRVMGRFARWIRDTGEKINL